MISISNDYQKNPSIPAPNQPDIISDAPSDILTFIASLLPMNNIVQFSLVSKKFYQITKNETLWKLFINKLQITWNEKVGARQELIALKKIEPGLHTHVAGLLGPTAFSNLPTLDNAFDLYHAYQQVTSSIMKGVRLTGLPFITIRYINYKNMRPTELGVIVVFQKYVTPGSKRDEWEICAASHFPRQLTDRTLDPNALDYMNRLITGKPCGQNPIFEQYFGSPKTMPDGKSVVELA